MVFGRYQKSRNFFPKLWTQGALVAVVVILTYLLNQGLSEDRHWCYLQYSAARRGVRCLRG